jgi:Leu/Phe-tRNA-protein transferase
MKKELIFGALGICLGWIFTTCSNSPGRYQIHSVEYTSPWTTNKTISVLVDTRTGRIQKLTQDNGWLYWWDPEPTKATWASWLQNSGNLKKTNTVTK